MAKRKTQASAAVTLKIPAELFRHLAKLIEGTGFRSVTEFAIYVLRDVAAGGRLKHPPAAKPAADADAAGLSGDEIEAVRKRLRALGYIE